MEIIIKHCIDKKKHRHKKWIFFLGYRLLIHLIALQLEWECSETIKRIGNGE